MYVQGICSSYLFNVCVFNSSLDVVLKPTENINLQVTRLICVHAVARVRVCVREQDVTGSSDPGAKSFVSLIKLYIPVV